MGTRIIAGRYEILEKVGDGGMAVVYKAKDRLLNRFVAIKILKPEFTRDAKFIESFRKESHAAASLNHPNIVSVYDVGREGNINYIVMELVEGITLSDMIYNSAPMPYKTVIEFAKQIAQGLSVAHKRGIIHRDVKPHNIMINNDGVAKITDFGIAKAITSTTITSNTSDNIMGSVHYFSPEQARGGYVDDKSDIYSLGIVIYEMLTGKIPFDGENPVSVALMHINNEMPEASDSVAGIPPRLEHVIQKATNKLPGERYLSIDEMIGEFSNIEMVSRVVGDSIVDTTKSEKINIEPTEEGGDIEEQEEDKSKKNKNKKKKVIIVASIAAAVIIIGVVVLFATGIIGGKNVTVPDLKGMTVEEATEALDELGLILEEGEEVYSQEYEIGQIASQNLKEGESVKEGSTITVNVCMGEEDGTVPNVVGMSEEEAKAEIEAKGYTVGTVTTTTSEVTAGEVVEQDPVGGETAKVGSTINIVISDGEGKEEGTVPYVLGRDISSAKASITEAGFTLGNISYDYSSTYPQGEVMVQEYSGGTTLEKETSINVTISNGPEPEPEVEPDDSSSTEV